MAKNSKISPKVLPKLPRFGAFLKDRRRRSVADVSKIEGVAISENSLSHIESGRAADFDPGMLKRLAMGYNVGILVLLWRLIEEKYIDHLDLTPARKALLEAAFLAGEPTNGLAPFADGIFHAKSQLVRNVNVIDVAGVTAITKDMENLKECWVVADDFAEIESRDLLTATVSCMNKNGTKFVYFFPQNKVPEFKRLKYDLQAPCLNCNKDIDSIVQGYVLGAAAVPWMLADYSIFNPLNTPPDFGFQFRRKDGKPHLGWQLDQVTLIAITSMLSEWKHDHADDQI